MLLLDIVLEGDGEEDGAADDDEEEERGGGSSSSSSRRVVFSPGSEVAGKVVLEVSGTLRFKSLSVTLSGAVRVDWTEEERTRGSGGSGGKGILSSLRQGKRVLTHTISSIISMLKNRSSSKKDFWKEEVSVAHDCCVLRGHTGGSGARERLPEGVHEFEFRLSLRDRAAVADSFEGRHGSVRYSVRAELEESYSAAHAVARALRVARRSDVGAPEFEVGWLVLVVALAAAVAPVVVSVEVVDIVTAVAIIAVVVVAAAMEVVDIFVAVVVAAAVFTAAIKVVDIVAAAAAAATIEVLILLLLFSFYCCCL